MEDEEIKYPGFCPICGAFAVESFVEVRKTSTPRLHIPIDAEFLMYKCQNGHIFMSEENLNKIVDSSVALEEKLMKGEKIYKGEKLV